jgi:hypothetical protein
MIEGMKRVPLSNVLAAAAVVIALLILWSDDNLLVGFDLFEMLLFVMVLFFVLRKR